MMRRPYSRLAAASALAVATASLTIGTAVAGGNPSAPGQQKKQDSTAQASTQSGSPSQGGNADASQPGMKPANDTAHGTSCTYQSSTTCTANSPKTSQSSAKQDASKHYGNGKTAAQIAASKGVPAGATIYGPGNSQPHKVVCPGGTKGPDVHAYKAGGKHSCPTTSASTSAAVHNAETPQSSSQANASASSGSPANASAVSGTSASTGTPQGTPANGAAPAASTSNAGGVLGATTTVAKPKSAPAHHGVLGTTARIRGGSLPFTGFPTWLAALLGVGMLFGGAVLRRGAASF